MTITVLTIKSGYISWVESGGSAHEPTACRSVAATDPIDG